ncbi:MAG: PBP1A family penicillin-binding protein [Acidobacteriaceae bacterium]|nr:PBP1A family penicillin-binding protein [Acidobacteriaceae bacterium]
MPVRIKLPSKKPSSAKNGRPSRVQVQNIALISAVALLAIAVIVVSVYYAKFARLTDEKLTQGPFPNSSLLYAAPQLVGIGDPGTPLQFAARLRESGYSEDGRTNPIGWFHLRPDAIEVFPGDRSNSNAEPGVIRFADGRISSIIALSDNTKRTEYTLEPELLSALYDKNREKRRLVRYDDIPPVLVDAVISIEDKRFFQHSGLDPIRIVKAMFVDLREHRNAQGASTLTQQLARNLWLDSRKTWTRKFDEVLITIHLERKLTKQKIFEYYANQVDLGRRGSFAIRGFGEAAQAYFGKGIRQLTLPEAATLAGLIQEPSYRNPVRWPERAKARRNVVLKAMLDNGYISASQYDAAAAAPMVIAKQGGESADAPYFVDLVNEQLSENFQDRNFQDSGSKIYTTLDPDLQRDAAEAVTTGLREVDALLAKRHKKEGTPIEEPQVALICLDPHTGEVKALIGGRNYGMSQLDHVIAKRPSGSIFKPFVYAAALNTGLWNETNPITTSTVFKDEPQTFYFAGQPYEPVDYHHGDWLGDVTLRTAFAKSLNVPAVEVAEQTGYGAVAQLAHKAGLEDIRATPAMALGSYDVTPLEMAAAYTIFANNGVQVEARMLSHITDQSGSDMWSSQPVTKKILDPRVNYLIVSLMQEVLRTGTGAGVRSRGFSLPAAGKTGTSHDAWFAGFTSKLLCIVWVGLDDYQDIKLEGAKAALPIWAEFMKKAHQHRAYRDVADFPVPEGIVSAQVDPETGYLASSACPRIVTDYYLLGTQPTQFCPLHLGGSTEIAGWETAPAAQAGNARSFLPAPNVAGQTAAANGGAVPPMQQAQNQPQSNAPPKKKSFFDKLKNIFH